MYPFMSVITLNTGSIFLIFRIQACPRILINPPIFVRRNSAKGLSLRSKHISKLPRFKAPLGLFGLLGTRIEPSPSIKPAKYGPS